MDLNSFRKRLNELYSCWKKHKEELWGNSDLLVIHTPPSNPPAVSSFFYFWLMGHDLPDTTSIFTQKEIHFICPKNKVSVLETLVGPAMEAVHAHVSVIGKEKGDDGLALMDDVIRRMSPLVLGCIIGEYPKMEVLKHMEYQFVTVNNGLSRLSKLFNHGNKKVKNLGNSGKMSNSRVDSRFNGSGRESQMRCVLDKFEPVLSLAKESKEKGNADKSRSHEENSYRVDSRFHSNGRGSQMQCVSDKFEPVLSLAKESKEKGNAAKLPPKVEEKKLLIEMEKGDASMCICHMAKVSSHDEQLEGNSDEYILLNYEEDEWELVD